MRPVSTFSIVGRDDRGDTGVAVASRFLAAGAVVPFAAGGVGAVATQSYANTTFGPRALEALEQGRSLDAIAQELRANDAQHETRQYGIVDAAGRSRSFTGSGCHAWAGGVSGQGFAVQGNLLAGPGVIEAMVSAFQAEPAQALADRLLAALLAGDRAGGDRRGRQSAALLVARPGGGYGGHNDRLVDLRVDDHPDPVPELVRLRTLHFLSFERPSGQDLLAIDGETLERLRAILMSAGVPGGASGPWGAADDAALRTLAGVENLEERLVEPEPGADGAPLGPPRVDRHVLDYLGGKFGP